MTRICVVSHHRSFAEACASRELQGLCRDDRFLVELRLDAYADLSPTRLSEALQHFGPKRCVVTFRSGTEGGKKPHVDDAQRFTYLRQALAAGAAYVDVEWQTVTRDTTLLPALLPAKTAESQLIVSFHDFDGTSDYPRLRMIRAAAEGLGADIVKIAVAVPTPMSALPLAQLLTEEAPWTRPLVGIAMGESGLWSRVLAPTFPHAAPFAFARCDDGAGTAPGQPTWRSLLELYRFDELGPHWPTYGVMGTPIAHSLSPCMHNAAMKHLGIQGIYVPFRVDDGPLDFVRELATRLGVRGLSVTLPHKETVMAACAALDPLAQRVGAINTLALTAGAWEGSNTDAEAAANCLAAALGGPDALRERTVVILGAGGVARAVAFGVRARGARVYLCGRTLARAEALAKAVGGTVIDRNALARFPEPIAAIVNCTPQGMHPYVDTTPLQSHELPPGALVFDTVYNPLKTKLLTLAQERGLATLDGLTMFVAQGAAQFTRFTGRAAPMDVMRDAVLAALTR